MASSSGTILKQNPFFEMILLLEITKKGNHRSSERREMSTRSSTITSLPRESTKRHRQKSGMNQSRSGILLVKMIVPKVFY